MPTPLAHVFSHLSSLLHQIAFTTCVSQDAVATRQKENAASAKPKHPAGSTQKQQPSGKENDTTHVVPRKTRAMASSGASPRLLKKALGQISLNSPRANQRLVMSSHKNKTLFIPPAESVVEPSPIQLSTAATGDDPTRETVTIDAAMRTSDNKVGVEKTLTVVEETKTDVRDESASAAAPVSAAEAGQEGEAPVSVTTDVLQGRPSMMVATANPRLQVSALPRGTVVRVRLFAKEETVPLVVPEVGQEEKITAANSAGKGETEQQQDEGDREVVTEERNENVEPPHQQQEENTTAVVTVCAQDVVASSSVAVLPEPATGEQKVEASVPSLLPEAEQVKDRPQQHYQQQRGGETAAPVSEENAAAGVGAAKLVVQVYPAVAKEEHVLQTEETTPPELQTATFRVVDEHHAGARMGEAPCSSALVERETIVTTVLPSQEKEEENDDQAPVLLSQQPAEEIAVMKKMHDDVKETVAAEHGVAVGDEHREGKGLAVVVPQHAGSVVDAETRSLVEESKYLQFADDERGVLCTLTGKKIAPAYDNILLYMGSKKVQQLMVEGPFFMTVSTSSSTDNYGTVCMQARAFSV